MGKMAEIFDKNKKEKLSKEAAVKAICDLNSKDTKTKKILTEFLDNGIIEIYKCEGEQAEIKVGLTNRGAKMFSTLPSLK
ncbi:MAG: hypothetical protein R6U26_00020 [Candidatus Undinarchaeales archaeon]